MPDTHSSSWELTLSSWSQAKNTVINTSTQLELGIVSMITVWKGRPDSKECIRTKGKRVIYFWKGFVVFRRTPPASRRRGGPCGGGRRPRSGARVSQERTHPSRRSADTPLQLTAPKMGPRLSPTKQNCHHSGAQHYRLVSYAVSVELLNSLIPPWFLCFE